jgi:hypothetical protein
MLVHLELVKHEMVEPDQTESETHFPLGKSLLHGPSDYKGYTF